MTFRSDQASRRRYALALIFVIALIGGLPTPEALADEAAVATPDAAACSTAAAQPAKKKGPGLGGLLGAAKRAGLGDMLTGQMGQGGALLGSGKNSQIFGAVAGTALQAVETGPGSSSAGLPNALGGLGGQSRKAQVAGALTGMAVQAAQSAAQNTPKAGPAC